MQTPNELLPDGLQMDLLWKNASPESAFHSQTITLNAELSQYRFICIECKFRTDRAFMEYNFIRPDAVYCVIHVVRDTIAWRYQTRAYSNLIEFGDGLFGSDASQEYCIPINIYGVK